MKANTYDNANDHGNVYDPSLAGGRGGVRGEHAHPELARWWAIVTWGPRAPELRRRAKVHISLESAVNAVDVAEHQAATHGKTFDRNAVKVFGYRTRKQALSGDISHNLETFGRMA